VSDEDTEEHKDVNEEGDQFDLDDGENDYQDEEYDEYVGSDENGDDDDDDDDDDDYAPDVIAPQGEGGVVEESELTETPALRTSLRTRRSTRSKKQ
jgi:hypothetical protein